MTVNHAWTKARLREMKTRGFGLREILFVPTPRSFPPTGFQLGVVHYQRAYHGPIQLTELAESQLSFCHRRTQAARNSARLISLTMER